MNENNLRQFQFPDLINILRFDTFSKIDETVLKEVLAKFPYCNIIGNEKKLCESINKKDFEQFKEFVNANLINADLTIKAFTTELDKSRTIKYSTINKNIKKIIDLYFTHKNSSSAYNMLSHLFDISFENQENCDNYFKSFENLSKEEQGKYRGYRC